MVRTVDINTDFGEGLGVYPFPMQVWRAEFEDNGPVYPIGGYNLDPGYFLERVSSINLACGYHAGDPLLMKRNAELAAQYKCKVGAHPSFPDLQGFGNRYMELSNSEIKAMIQYQIGALEGILGVCGLKASHVKCHGALYNRAVKDESLASSVVEGVAEYRDSLPLVVPAQSALEYAASLRGVPYIREVFADRMYEPSGELVSRKKPNSMVTDPHEVAQRVLKMAKSGEIVANDGSILKVEIDTICFHTDTPGVGESLDRAIRLLGQNDIGIE